MVAKSLIKSGKAKGEDKQFMNVAIEKWNIKTVGAKERQIFFNGKVKQNKVGVKEKQIFFSGRAKQNVVGSKEWLDCPALMFELKRGTLFLQLYFVLFYH